MATIHIHNFARDAEPGYAPRENTVIVLELSTATERAALALFRTLCDQSDADRVDLYLDSNAHHIYFRDALAS